MKRKQRIKAAEILPQSNGSPAASQNPAANGQRESQTIPTLLVGIDWADEEHTYAMCDPLGNEHRGTVKQSATAITQLLDQWRTQFPDARIDICLETSRGPLINVLLEQRQVQLYPINPHALASYRKAFAHGGGKNDPVDAGLILQYLQYYRPQLRPLQQDSSATRELEALTEHRRGLVEQRVVLAQQLTALLKAYFPTVLDLKPAKIYADFVVRLLLKYPTLADVQAAGRTKLRKLFFGLGTKQKIEWRLDLLFCARPLVSDEVLLRTSARRATAIARQLLALNHDIADYERAIQSLVKQHADYAIVQSLPCGAKSQARIIAALGDDRARFSSPEELAAAVGIAPLTTQSGKQRFVSSRWACSKFRRQTFHEFAGISITRSRWAEVFYRQQLSRGKSTQTARRALAYKWIRIIYRCWQTRQPYDEARYEQRLRDTQSPLAQQLAA